MRNKTALKTLLVRIAVFLSFTLLTQCQTRKTNKDRAEPSSESRPQLITEVEIISIDQNQGAKIGEKDQVTIQTDCLAVHQGAPTEVLQTKQTDVDLASDQIITGIKETIIGQSNGSIIRVRIPPNKGYGEKGLPTKIQSNTILDCTIKILQHRPKN